MVALKVLPIAFVLSSAAGRVSAQTDESKAVTTGDDEHWSWNLFYGTQYNAPRTYILKHPDGPIFDDSDLILGSKHPDFKMRKVTCHGQVGHGILGFKEYYSGPKEWPVESEYHGADARIFRGKYDNSYTLKSKDEHWTTIEFRHCGEVFTGMRFSTNLGNGVSCGNFNAADVGPHKVCSGKKLSASAGREIVALYGNANGALFTKNQGILGIGLVTNPIFN